MHAICKDPSAFAKPCVYLQLEEGSEPGGEDGEEDEGEEGEEGTVAEVRLVPSDEAQGGTSRGLCACRGARGGAAGAHARLARHTGAAGPSLTYIQLPSAPAIGWRAWPCPTAAQRRGPCP